LYLSGVLFIQPHLLVDHGLGQVALVLQQRFAVHFSRIAGSAAPHIHPKMLDIAPWELRHRWDLTTLGNAILSGAHTVAVHILGFHTDHTASVCTSSHITPLQCALWAGNEHVALVLLERCSVAECMFAPNGGMNAMAVAARNALLEVMAAMLTKNYRFASAGRPLAWAASGGHLAAVALLLQHNPSDAKCYKTGDTPLHHAARAGAAIVVRRLVADRPAGNVANYDGCLPIHCAAIRLHCECLTELRADTTARLRGKNVDAMTPLHLVARHCCQRNALAIRAAKVLVGNGAELLARSQWGTALDVASMFKNADLVHWLAHKTAVTMAMWFRHGNPLLTALPTELWGIIVKMTVRKAF
jgi:hypothetical protein